VTSTASGYGSTASGNYSTAIGRNSTASGYNSKASGNGSTAIGSLYLSPNDFGSYNNIENSVTFDGKYNSSYPTVHPNAYIHVGYLSNIIIRNSDQTSTSASVSDITTAYPNAKSLQYYFDQKQDTLVSGTNIKTINGSSVLGTGDLAISGTVPLGTIYGTGTGNLAVGDGSVAGTSGQNYNNMTAIGSGAKARYDNTVSIGTNADSSLANSVAVGYNSKANGESVAIGYATNCYYHGIAVGFQATALGNYSAAIGHNSSTSSNADYSSYWLPSKNLFC
jgi:hypothetical protein